MNRVASIAPPITAVLAVVLAAVPAVMFVPAAIAAGARLPLAADGTTNIADCAKVAVALRNECISRARPVSGQQIYAKLAIEQRAAAKAAAIEQATRAKAEAVRIAAERRTNRIAAERARRAFVASAPKGLKVDVDGATDLATCLAVPEALRSPCLSRARALTGPQLVAFLQTRTSQEIKASEAAARQEAATAAAAARAAEAAGRRAAEADRLAVAAQRAAVDARNAAVAAQVAADAAARRATLSIGTVPTAPPATTSSRPGVQRAIEIKGFNVGVDGTTDISECASAKPEYKNECISRARPITGSSVYGRGGNS